MMHQYSCCYIHAVIKVLITDQIEMEITLEEIPVRPDMCTVPGADVGGLSRPHPSSSCTAGRWR